MWRMLLLTVLLAAFANVAHAQQPAWDLCRGGPGPIVTECRPLVGKVDPQGRELWLRGDVPPRRDDGHKAMFIIGAASSEVWFNGVRLGGNGRPGATAAAEIPGRYHAEFPIPDALWRSSGNELIVRLSAFHTGVRFASPMGWIGVGSAQQPSALPLLAVTFAAAGALAASAFGFGAIWVRRRTGSSLMLAGLAAVAALQALVESLRHVWRYDYPVHAWRMTGIWLLSLTFALLLVAWAASRFLPGWRGRLLGAAAALLPLTWFVPGFDVRTWVVLLIGVGFAAIAALVGVRSRLPGARPALAWLALFLALAIAQPFWLLDMSFFVLAAGLVLPLLVAEVLRLGRDDHEREAALTRAASRPDRLTVASARGVQLVPLAEIVAAVGADDYVELRLSGDRTLLHATRLDRLETQLPADFLRIHRSVIANLTHVRSLERDGGRWRLQMVEGPPLPVSRSRLPALRDALDEPGPLRASA